MVLYINTNDSKLVRVALKKDARVISQLSEVNQYGSQVLLLLIIKILKKNTLNFKDLSGIEVETGPGSFTGLKVGASVAQALGYALNIPVNTHLNKMVNLIYT